MDLTDPQTMVTLLSSAFGTTLAKWIVAAMIWQSSARILLKPLQSKIQAGSDAFQAWLHQDGNTDIHKRIEAIESKPWLKFGFWLLDYALSIKLGSQRATTVTTKTETATITAKIETPAQVGNEPTVTEKTTETAASTTKTETPNP